MNDRNEARIARAGAALLRWHAKTERDLPWRGENDPYRIWISETMLQQTRAAHAAGRFLLFCERFPDVFALSRASEEEVLSLWQGMGYYARARNLRKAAIRVAEEFGGRFPNDADALMSLPGVGLYTACAIRSMAFGEPVAAVDANLERVISRFFTLRGFLEDNGERIRALADDWLRVCASDRPGDFNRAMMGLGALVCASRAPKCDLCPIAEDCAARAEGIESALPDRKPKPAKKIETRGMAFALSGPRILVRKRPETGMLASLWEFPHFCFPESAISQAAVAENLEREGYPCEPLPVDCVQTEFAFTHKIWKIRAWTYRLCGDISPNEPYRLLDAAALSALPMPSVMEPYRKRALLLMQKSPSP